jgi:oxygen-independent coproporphyrinogen III oxidase
LAGIYIHIPYCKAICHYCDFYKTANIRNIDQFIESLILEIRIKKSLFKERIETLYFGGGTPSLLSIQQLKKVFDQLKSNYDLSDVLESTIEINPDDVTFNYLQEIKSLGFNRLSIGIQSFNNDLLIFLNRKHNQESALNCINNAQNAGFKNISIDLIYGISNQSIENFSNDLEIAKNLNIQHLSAYHLGIEENSYFGKLKKTGRFTEISDDRSEEFYNYLINWSIKNDFEHYEVSNFAKNGFYSKHNKGYWFSSPYLGLGPSAHSYTGDKRIFNISNVNEYIRKLGSNDSFFELEELSSIDKYNEYIMLRLRTKWGVDINEMKLLLSSNTFDKIMRSISLYSESDYLRINNNSIILTEKGYFISDSIIRNLFISKD